MLGLVRPPVTAAAPSDVTHTRRSGRRGQDVSAMPTGRTDARTDGLTPQGRKPAPTAPPHPPQHTGHTRAPRPPRHTRHTRHTRQAGQAHASAGPAAPATQTRTSRRGQDVHPPRSRCMCHRPSPRWTDGRTRARRQRPPVTAAAHSDVTHESTHVEADAVVKMSLPSPQDGRTDSTRCACRRGRQDGAILTEEGARQQGLTAYRNAPPQ
uniref:Erythroid differentiation regulator n=2 Tax=Mus musculus TaxID=10090 RepID=Q811B0_MOUSE|nr:erythroid differentiation regulator [Mus musculus]